MDDTGVSYGPPVAAFAPETSVAVLPDYIPDYTPVVPPGDSLAMAMAAASGGVSFVPASSGPTADPSGVSALVNDPAVNPTPNGGWQTVAQNLISAATKGFSTFVAGSPTAGIPGARSATGKSTGGLLTTATGQTNWPVVALVIGGAALGVWLLIKVA